VDHAIFQDNPPSSPSGPTIDIWSGDVGKGGDGEKADRRASRIVGVSLLGSGIFLCSWGIVSWEIRDYQCCPANNTGNVVKIVAGVLLINAGLIYLLAVET
jgi:hypothetical protein